MNAKPKQRLFKRLPPCYLISPGTALLWINLFFSFSFFFHWQREKEIKSSHLKGCCWESWPSGSIARYLTTSHHIQAHFSMGSDHVQTYQNYFRNITAFFCQFTFKCVSVRNEGSVSECFSVPVMCLKGSHPALFLCQHLELTLIIGDLNCQQQHHSEGKTKEGGKVKEHATLWTVCQVMYSRLKSRSYMCSHRSHVCTPFSLHISDSDLCPLP